jgi:hypothetical protein
VWNSVQVQKSPEHVSASSVQMKGENKSCSSEIDCLFVCFFFFPFVMSKMIGTNLQEQHTTTTT